MPPKNDIANRSDIDFLIRTFYKSARQDDLLGPVFDATIKTDAAWEKHFSTITDFWDANLFFEPVYSGNPVTAHIRADAAVDHSISQVHFARWLSIWFEKIDTYFAGQKANLAKTNARKMSTMLFMRMYQARK